MTVSLSPLARMQFNQGGIPLAGGKLFTYAAGTTTKLATYTDSFGATPNTNPIILDANGQCDIWLTDTVAYKFVLSPSTDTDPPTNAYWTKDNISNTPSPNPQFSTISVSGNASVGTLNKVTITQPATAATLTIANNKTLAANNSLTFAGVDGKTLTVNNSLSLAGTDGKSLTVNNNLTLAGTDGSTLNVGTGGTLGTAAFTNSSAYVNAGAVTSSGLTMNTSKLLGRTSASSGAVEEISVGSGLTLSGGSLTSSSPLTASFVSSQQTITAAGSLTLAHGLGVQPKLFQLFLKCVTSEGGYTAGDIIQINSGTQGISTGQGTSVTSDATNVYIKFGSNAVTYGITNKSDGTNFGITNANWNLIVKAWA